MSSPDPTPDTRYGVRWKSNPNRPSTIIPSRDAASAATQARRVRALQRVFGNPVDAVAVYQVGGGEWMLLLPAIADEIIAQFQAWLDSRAADPDTPPTL